MFASRDQLVDHLNRHAHEDDIELKLGTRVERITRSDGQWALDTSNGELRAPQVIIATGYESEPLIPKRAARAIAAELSGVESATPPPEVTVA